MNELEKYIRLHWKSLVAMLAGILLCSIAEALTIRYSFRQWNSDRTISSWRILSGAFFGITGMLILIKLAREKLKRKENWVKSVLLLVLTYSILQIIAGSVWGSLGLLSYLKLGMSYASSQTLIDICIAIWQNLVRAVVLYILLAWKNGLDWKNHIMEYKVMFFVAACLAAIPILLNLLEDNIFTTTVAIIWTCLYIIAFTIVFDSTMRGKEI